jgi:HAD superfamily hydrolase (TIGR01509 family)
MQTVSLRGIVFDFDGVIANSEPLHFEGFRQVLAEQGVTLMESDYYQRYLGYDDAGAFAAIAADRGLQWSEHRVSSLVQAKAAVLEDLEARQSVLFPGAAAAIRRLAADGPIAIASGALRAEIFRILIREDLAGYFTLVVAAEDAEASKPSPAPYLKAVAQLAAAKTGSADPAGYVAIEDSHWGLESARRAGLRTVAVTHTYSADELQADLTVSNLDDLTWTKLTALTTTV